MKYFFDESGNWDYLSASSTYLLGGVIIDDKDFKTIVFEMENFKSSHQIKSLHGCDNSNEINAKMAIKAADWLSKSRITGKVVLFSSSYIKREKSKYDPIDFYMKEAVDFVKGMILGDQDININWDPKFNFSHLESIIQGMRKNNFWDSKIKNIRNSYQMIPELVEKRFESLKGRLSKKKSPGKIISGFKQKLKEMSEAKDRSELLTDFDLSELDLYLTKTLLTREKFNQKINDACSQYNEMFSLSEPKKKPRVMYVDKYQSGKEKNGVEIADFLCNLVYKNGAKPPLNGPSAIKTIYANTRIEVKS